MTDFESLVKRDIRYKKHLGIIGILEKLFKTTIITRHILDLKMNLIIDKLLESILAIEK